MTESRVIEITAEYGIPKPPREELLRDAAYWKKTVPERLLDVLCLVEMLRHTVRELGMGTGWIDDAAAHISVADATLRLLRLPER